MTRDLALLRRRARRPRAAAADHRHGLGSGPVAAHRRRGVRRGGAGPGHRGAAAGVAAADRAAPGAGPGLRLRADRPGGRPGLSGRDGRRGGRQRAGPGPVPGQRAGARRGRPGPGAATGGRRSGGPLRRDLVQPADPDRQGGPARAAAHLAGPARARRGGPAGGGAEPRRGHPAALAHRAGVPGRACRVEQGLPGAGGSRVRPG